MGSCLADLGKTYVEKLINGALAELRHVFCFTCIANEFKEKKGWLEAEIETLEQRANVAVGRDNDILANVHFWKDKADKLIQEDIIQKQKCFFGLCPDCIWRYKKGKELAKKLEEIKLLTEKGEKLETIELPRRLPDVERFSSKDYISFPSRESKYTELLDALKDENNCMIVLQGMGGTGKTTLAKKVGQELKLSGQFAHVIVTTVSFTPDTKKIQDDIAGPLGLKWEDCNDSDRPGKLWSRLTNGDKVLLIMDDVWDQDPPLDFDLIGIPKQDKCKGCRVLITTRSKKIFNIMGCDKMIELELLSEEEAWTMFKKYAGLTNSFSKSLITKGHKIAEECKRLPVAIAVIASSLKGQQHRKHEWDVTLKSLKKHVAMDNVDNEKVGVYKCLKSSYDYMKNEKAKGLFLLSSLFPEDKEIPIEILTRLGIGTGLFGEAYDNYNDARDIVVATKNKLIDSCLLLEVGEKHVKMHDLVREAAHWIAYKEIRSVNLSNKDVKSSFQREMNVKYLFCEAKGMDLFSCKYDGSKLEILIVDMERNEDPECMEVPNSFFENIGKLQVLYFSGHDKRPLSLPGSIPSLTNIRSILVDGIDLGNISVLGNLQSLETLDLVKCIIDELPNEIANLGKFKLLKLEKCEIRRNDPFEVIGRCSTLEELYFINSFNVFCREITLPQLQRYQIIKGWSHIDKSLSKSIFFNAGDGKCFFSKETLKYCMQTTKGLELIGVKDGWKNLMPEIVPIDLGMKDLVELHLNGISQLQCLIDTSASRVSNVLSKLVVLELYGMENLEELFKGSLPLNLCNLKTVTVRDCPLLVNLSPLLTSRNLEYLEIIDCEGLRNIIIDERGEERSDVSMFPKLKVLEINNCHLLESILPFLSSQDLPVLETLSISECDELKYIFGQYQHVEFNSLKKIQLWDLPKFKGMFQKYSHSLSSHVNESSSTSRDGFEAQTQVDPIKYNIFSWSCICCHGNSHRHKLGSMSTTKIPSPSVHVDPLQNNSSPSVSNSHLLRLWQRAQCLRVQPYFMCNIKEIVLAGSLNIKSVFILSITPRMLVENLIIGNCDDELKHIIEDTRDDEICGNDLGNVFPKLRTLSVFNCRKLEYIFGNYTDDYQTHTKIHLPTLQDLDLNWLPSLVSMCPKQYCLTFPSLKKLEIKECSQLASKNIGDFNIPSDSGGSLDNTIMKELSGSIDLHYMTCLFVGPKNSFALENLTRIEIVRCEILEIIFTTSILRCLSQLVFIKIKECKELKHIIKDDRQDQNLSQRTCFPKLESLVVRKCHKLKCVFPVSICKELPELKALRISDADELEEIFKSEGVQKVEIPNINVVVLINLPSLFHAQGIQFQTARNRFVHNCQKLTLTIVYSSSFGSDIRSLNIDYDTREKFLKLFRKIRSGEIGLDTGNENPSAATTKDSGVGVGIEVEATLGHNFTSSQIQMEQTLEAENEFVKNASDLATTSVAILPTNSKELEKEQSTSQQDLINQQDLLGEINTTSQDVEEGSALTNVQSITPLTHLELDSSSQELEKEQPTSQQGLINQQDLLGEINTTIKPSQDVEEGTALTKDKTITASTHFELVSSSQMNEQDVGVRDSLETTMINYDQVPLNEDTIMKVSSIIEEEFPKGDEFTVLKSKPSSRDSVPLPLAFQNPSIHFEGNPSQKVEDLSSPYHVTWELEELVSTKHLDYENLSLLTDFLVKHPSILLRDISLSNRYKGYAYNCLAELLKFLQTHSVLDVLGSSHSKFVELLHDVRRCDFDKDWLDGVEKRALFPDLQFSQDALEKVLDSKKQVTKDVEVVRFKIDILTQNVEDLKQQLSSSEAELESIIQQEKEIVESKAALSAPLGY